MAKSFLTTIGENNTKHFYEADVNVLGLACVLEIQANDAGHAKDTAKAAGYTLVPFSLKFIC